VTVLDISGRLTTGAGEQQLRQLISELVDEGRTNVLLNLEELEFMDSAGLGSLVVGSQLLQRQGGRLQVVNARGPVQHVFQITRLTKVFPVFQDEDGAMASFQA
jgi:anti-sigma B factor antagonist